MGEDSQFIVPPSFIALFVPPGRVKPTAPRETIVERYDFCEDLANMLTEQARDIRAELGVTEDDVLERIHRGLQAPGAGVDPAEARWVATRLAELLEWPWEPPQAPPTSD